MAHIPVVMVTALGDPADRIRGINAGADDFLSKPINDVALFARVRSLLRLKLALDELRLRGNYHRSVSMAVTDSLTGLYNRHYLDTYLEVSLERSRVDGKPLAVAIIDIDFFKAVNNTHGHPAGDNVLRTVAGRFLSRLRPYDEIFRYGGEEFLICLPGTDAVRAAEVAERLRLSLADQPMRLADGTVLPLTASFGLCLTDEAVPLKQTIEQADAALYLAKNNGRNRFEMWVDA